MDAWYKDSPCAARFSAQGNSYIQCYGLNVPYQWVINDCYVNGNNGLGSYTMKGDLKVTISACAGIWSKKRNEIDPEDNIDLNNLRELKTLTKREEVADIVGDLISGAIKTEKNHVVDGTSVFGLPFSRSEAMSVCEIARYSESSELAKKYGCSS